MLLQLKDLFFGERDSMHRSIHSVILFLNINRGGQWTYNKDMDRYEDMKSNQRNQPYEIKYYR